MVGGQVLSCSHFRANEKNSGQSEGEKKECLRSHFDLFQRKDVWKKDEELVRYVSVFIELFMKMVLLQIGWVVRKWGQAFIVFDILKPTLILYMSYCIHSFCHVVRYHLIRIHLFVSKVN